MAAYTEVSDEEITKFLSNGREWVPQEALVGGPDSGDWRAEEARGWLAANDGEIVSAHIPWNGHLAIEIYKQVDDWFWVVLNLEVSDFFFKSPLLERRESELLYRCDQLTGLIALLEWACPADIKKVKNDMRHLIGFNESAAEGGFKKVSEQEMRRLMDGQEMEDFPMSMVDVISSCYIGCRGGTGRLSKTWQSLKDKMGASFHFYVIE